MADELDLITVWHHVEAIVSYLHLHFLLSFWVLIINSSILQFDLHVFRHVKDVWISLVNHVSLIGVVSGMNAHELSHLLEGVGWLNLSGWLNYCFLLLLFVLKKIVSAGLRLSA